MFITRTVRLHDIFWSCSDSVFICIYCTQAGTMLENRPFFVIYIHKGCESGKLNKTYITKR